MASGQKGHRANKLNTGDLFPNQGTHLHIWLQKKNLIHKHPLYLVRFQKWSLNIQRKVIVAWFYYTPTIPGMHLLCKSRHSCKIFVQNFTKSCPSFRKSYPVTTLCVMLPVQHTLTCTGSLWFYIELKASDDLILSFRIVIPRLFYSNTFYSIKKCLSLFLLYITVRALYSLFKSKYAI